MIGHLIDDERLFVVRDVMTYIISREALWSAVAQPPL
jgi:hypothetical protein